MALRLPEAETIEEILAAGEGQTVEFKLAFPAQARDLAHEIAAFARAGAGGTVYLGISDSGDVVGLQGEAGDLTQASLRDRVEGIVRGVAPAVAPDVDLIDYGGRLVCRVVVRPG